MVRCFPLLIVLLVGCDSSATIRGTVTLDDKPIENGVIEFEAVDKSTPSAGAPIKDGKYSGPVPMGKMKVSIRWPKVVGQVPLYGADGPTRPVSEEAVPKKYNAETTLEYDVVRGVNEKNWVLTTK